MNESILVSIKKMLGIDENYDAFDVDIIAHINAALMIARQIGVGKDIRISGERERWCDFIEDERYLNGIQSYIYEKVKMAFDPPSSSVAVDASKSFASELEWRLNLISEGSE